RQIGQQVQLRVTRLRCATIGQVDDFALQRTVYRAVRLIYKIGNGRRVPVIAARLTLVTINALLHDGPFAVGRHEETVQIEVESILHRGAVDLRDETARPCEVFAVDSDT